MTAGLDRLDDEARRAVALAEEEARTLRHEEIGDDHLLLGLAHVAPDLVGVPVEAVRARVAAGRAGEEGEPWTRRHLSDGATRVLSIASRGTGKQPVRPADLLAAVIGAGGMAADTLSHTAANFVASD
jgi:Clp amino terminal domain, pathogenicity island component